MYRSYLPIPKLKNILRLHDNGFKADEISNFVIADIEEINRVIIGYMSGGVIIEAGLGSSVKRRLSMRDEEEVYKLLELNKLSYKDIADKFGVSRETIRLMARNYKVQLLT